MALSIERQVFLWLLDSLFRLGGFTPLLVFVTMPTTASCIHFHRQVQLESLI